MKKILSIILSIILIFSNTTHTFASTVPKYKPNKTAICGDDWLYTDGNKIVDKDGNQVWLTGVNWFGYNTGTNCFDGIWNANLTDSLKDIANHGFNLLRVPISAELILQWKSGNFPTANYNSYTNPELTNKNSLEIFDYVVNTCQKIGLKIILDIHSAETDAYGHNVSVWYTDKISTKQYYQALEWIVNRYKTDDTIIAIDLKNEPHGTLSDTNYAIWNNSKDKNNWKYIAETASKKVLAKNPNLLIVIEGVEIYPTNIKTNNYTSKNSGDYYYNWWGGNLRGVKDNPINLSKYQNKVIYSPHDYGPLVYNQSWFQKDFTYNTLLKDCWNDNWFYIHKENIAPLLIGEWGGYMTGDNLKWLTALRKLIKTNKISHTFWCYNANSGDTGGLIKDDFTTWDTEKYNFVKSVLWKEKGKFVSLDHKVKLGDNGINLTKALK